MIEPYTYTFVFDKLTIGDAQAFTRAVDENNMFVVLTIVDKCMPGVFDLPMRETANLMCQFTVALKQYMDTTPDASRLLKRALGEQDTL